MCGGRRGGKGEVSRCLLIFNSYCSNGILNLAPYVWINYLLFLYSLNSGYSAVCHSGSSASSETWWEQAYLLSVIHLLLRGKE